MNFRRDLLLLSLLLFQFSCQEKRPSEDPKVLEDSIASHQDSLPQVDDATNPIKQLEVIANTTEETSGADGTKLFLEIIVVNKNTKSASDIRIQSIHTKEWTAMKQIVKDTIITVIPGPVAPGDTAKLASQETFMLIESRQNDLGISNEVLSAEVD